MDGHHDHLWVLGPIGTSIKINKTFKRELAAKKLTQLNSTLTVFVLTLLQSLLA